MLKNIIACLAAASSLLCANLAVANQAFVTGTFSVAANGGMFSSEPSKKDREAAVQGAKLNAWNNYTGRFSQARIKQLSANQDAVNANLDQFMTNVTVIDEHFDGKSGTLKVAVRALVNETRVDDYFSQLSNAGKAKSGDGAIMAFVFLSRQQDSVKQFDVKRTRISELTVGTASGETTTENSRSQGANAADSSIEQASVTKTAKSVTGGNVERKSDRIVYRVSSSENIDTAMSDALTSGGFEIVSYADILGECGGEPLEKVRSEFVESDEMSAPTRKKLLDAARTCDVRFMATGTLDIGAPDVDPVSGSRRVFVSVRGQVLDLQHKLPRRVASVGPVQYSGIGGDETIAMINALNKAAKESARALIDQLNVKGIH
ncbi:MAG: hypothetical protein V7642_4659 [Burkholderiales bacterium]|jgi:hypothetical protein